MGKRSIFLGVLIASVFFFVGLAYLEGNYYSLAGNPIKKINLAGGRLSVEVVKTPEKLALGLGGRKNICMKCGMLFVFPGSSRHSFWMKGMEFPLDIIWLDEGSVVAIRKNVLLDSRETLNPDVLSDKVLEVKAGTADQLGIELGDTVIF